MGWADKALARAKILAEQGAQVAKELAAEADAALASKNPGYESFKQDAKAGAAEVRQAASRRLAEFGETDKGRKIGEGTRLVTAKLASLPVFSAAVDAAKARHDIEGLAAAFKDDPAEPMRAIHLAEAMDRVQSDLKIYRAARTVVDPMFLVHRQVVVTAASLGQDATDPTRLALLKRAFAQSKATLIRRTDDADALHALGRIYLMQGDTTHAAVAAALACRLVPTEPLYRVTLARCHLVANELDAATRVAEGAAADGASYGNEILAQVALRREGTATERAQRFEQLRTLVTPEGRKAYLGTDVDGQRAMEMFRGAQEERARELSRQIKGES